MTTKNKILWQIKLFCQECMGSDRARKGEMSPSTTINADVENCTASACLLYSFREGKDPAPSKSKIEAGRKMQRRQAGAVDQLKINDFRFTANTKP